MVPVVDPHLGVVLRGEIDVPPAVCPPGSVDLLGFRAPAAIFMAEVEIVDVSFCPPFPSSSRYGFSWLYSGDFGGGVMCCWCFALVVFAACTGGSSGWCLAVAWPGSGGVEARRAAPATELGLKEGGVSPRPMFVQRALRHRCGGIP